MCQRSVSNLLANYLIFRITGIPLRGAKDILLLFINELMLFPTETSTPSAGAYVPHAIVRSSIVWRRNVAGVIAVVAHDHQAVIAEKLGSRDDVKQKAEGRRF